MAKIINLKSKKVIGRGSFAIVYKVSPRRVVKVFRSNVKEELDLLLEDEVKGGKTLAYALPVLKVVNVITPRGRLTRGLLKQFIPYPVTLEEIWAEIPIRIINKIWDIQSNNIRRDSKGRLWLVDTQTEGCWRCSR